MPNLSDRLKALGVRLGARDLPPPRPKAENPYAVTRILPGKFLPTDYGPVFAVEKWFGADYRHGHQPAAFRPAPPLLSTWLDASRPACTAAETVAYLDTETTGLSGGTGTYAFMVGVAFYRETGLQTVQLFMTSPDEEPALLAALSSLLQGTDTLVTFNGKEFDVPLLQTRYRLNRMESPLDSPVQLDLLPLARRLWRDRLPERSLGYLEQAILGATRTEEDVPGRLIPYLYFSYLRSGDARPLRGVFYHNRMDLLAMAGLLNHVADLLESPLDGRVAHPLDRLALARLCESAGRVALAEQLYRLSLEAGLPEESYQDALARLSALLKRQGRLAQAIPLWEEAAQAGQIYACVELAKYYEHTARDLTQALRWTEAGLSLLTTPSRRARWHAELRHRQKRLHRRLGR
ncbi:MAG: hypothetical protein D6784_05880 [Chloroflexi bacterium]|nr:MAG: hypothetical protein D6784_05880 [Chloroflexota bacterium]